MLAQLTEDLPVLLLLEVLLLTVERDKGDLELLPTNLASPGDMALMMMPGDPKEETVSCSFIILYLKHTLPINIRSL